MAHFGMIRSAAAFLSVLAGMASFADGELVFEANRGQAEAESSFLARADGYQVLVGPSGVALRLPVRSDGREQRVELSFLDAATSAALAGAGERPERVHYVAGADAAAWIANVPTFTGVVRSDPYPGIALAYRGDGRRLAIDLTVAPGADPSAVRLGVRGARATRLNAASEAQIVTLGGGEVRLFVEDGAASFVVRGTDELGLVLNAPDRETARSVRIVVTVPPATARFASLDRPRVATDAEGDAYVTGRHQVYPGERTSAFVAKIAADGRTRLFTTYFGSSPGDTPLAIAVDPSGEPVIVGRAAREAAGRGADAFIVKLAADGSALRFSRNIGTDGDDEARAVALDSSGSAWVAGVSSSPRPHLLLARFGPDGSPLPIPGAVATLDAAGAAAIAIDAEGAVYLAGPSRAGAAFVAKIDPRADVPRYTTHLASVRGESVTDLAVDGFGLVRVAGSSPSGRFMATLESGDGTVRRADRFPEANAGEAAGLAGDGEGGAWLAGAGQLALRLDRNDRVTERFPDERPEGRLVVTGIASSGSESAFLAGVTSGAGGAPFLPIASSPSGGTVVAGLIPSLPAAPGAAGCPGTIQFTNGGGTSLWQTPANWNAGHVPLSSDDVCIPAGFAVTLSSGAQSVNSVFVAATSSLAVSASLTLAAASQFDGSLTLQTSGTLTGAGDITCAGTFTWNGGAISGAASFFANGGMTVSGAPAHDLTSSRLLDVSGATTWTGTGGVRIGSSAAITNHGTWDCQSNAGISNLGSAGTFTNLSGATFKKSVATGTTTVSVPFANAGTTSIQSGVLNLSGGGTHSGSFTGSAGTTLSFGGGTHTLNTGSSVNLPTVVFDAGIVNLDGTYAATTATTISGATTNFNAAGTVSSIGGALTLSSGTANFASGENIAPATLTFSGGTLQGTDSVTVSGALTWTAGTMSGAGTTNANGGIALSGAAAHDLTTSRVLNVSGTTTSIGTGSLRMGSGATITNNGIWDCQTDAAISNLGSAGAFTNALGSTFKKSGGAGTTTVTVPFANTGVTSVLSGALSLNGGGTHTGSFTGSAGTTLQFSGGTHALAVGSSIAAHSVVFDAGTINVDGTYAASAGTTVSGATVNFNPASTLSSIGTALTISGGTANFSSGGTVSPTTLGFSGGTLQGADTVAVSGTTTWSAGTMTGAGTVNANGGLVLSGAATRDVTASRVLNVAGTTTWTGTGHVRIGPAATIANTGTWDCQSDAQIANLGSAQGFTNALGATFRKSASAGTTTVGVPFVSAGSINIVSGTLALIGGGTYSGPLTGAGGTVLRFGGGTHALGAASSVAAPNVVFDGGTVNVDGAYAASAGTTISGGVANFNPAATLSSVGGILTISSGSADFSSGEPVTATTMSFASGSLQGTDSVTVSGLMTWTAGIMSGSGTTNANGGIDLGGAAAHDLTAGRTLNVAGTTTLTGSGSVRLGSAASIVNTGTWDWQSSSALAQLGSAGSFTNGVTGVFKKSAGAVTSVEVPFVNAGAVEALASALHFTGGYTQISGSTTQSVGTITSNTRMDIQAGTLTGVGTATGGVINAGHAVPGLSIGTLTLSGNYTQTSAGSLDIQLGGRIAGTEHDQLNLVGSGIASFAGTLNVALTNGFVPIGGDSFTLMSYTSSTGAFSASSFPPLAQGCWRTLYNPTALVLQVWTVAPEATGVIAAADKTTLSWNPLPPAAGPSATYDLMRGALGQFPVGGKPSETCIAPGISTTSAADATVPAAGTGFYYLVRGSNTCGVGGYGTAKNGTPRTPTVCP